MVRCVLALVWRGTVFDLKYKSKHGLERRRKRSPPAAVETEAGANKTARCLMAAGMQKIHSDTEEWHVSNVTFFLRFPQLEWILIEQLVKLKAKG